MFLPEEHSTSRIALAVAPRPDPVAVPKAHAPLLSELELRVVEIALTDALDTLKPRRRHGWFVRLFQGRERASPALANAKLEAIRRLVVMARHHRADLPARHIGEARAAGLSADQIVEILAITRGSAGAPIEKAVP